MWLSDGENEPVEKGQTYEMEMSHLGYVDGGWPSGGKWGNTKQLMIKKAQKKQTLQIFLKEELDESLNVKQSPKIKKSTKILPRLNQNEFGEFKPVQ